MMSRFASLTLVILLVIVGSISNVANSSEWQDSAVLSVKAVVSPYTSVKLSTNEIAFEILGEPGEYISKDLVEVTVGSNQSTWGVYVRAAELKHSDRRVKPLPAQRLSFSKDGKSYQSLEDNVLFLKGLVAQQPRPIKLRFKLTTTWEDAPGLYKGKITFAFLNNP
jgi:hypothetical protein